MECKIAGTTWNCAATSADDLETVCWRRLVQGLWQRVQRTPADGQQTVLLQQPEVWDPAQPASRTEPVYIHKKGNGKDAYKIGLRVVHLFSTSPNSCQRLTMLNADVPNCYITL